MWALLFIIVQLATPVTVHPWLSMQWQLWKTVMGSCSWGKDHRQVGRSRLSWLKTTLLSNHCMQSYCFDCVLNRSSCWFVGISNGSSGGQGTIGENVGWTAQRTTCTGRRRYWAPSSYWPGELEVQAKSMYFYVLWFSFCNATGDPSIFSCSLPLPLLACEEERSLSEGEIPSCW